MATLKRGTSEPYKVRFLLVLHYASEQNDVVYHVTLYSLSLVTYACVPVADASQERTAHFRITKLSQPLKQHGRIQTA